MKNIINTLLPIISIFISNYLGRQSQKIKYQNENKMDRYDIAYIPLLNRLIIDLPNSPNFILDDISAIYYADIILNNLHYYEEKTWQNFYPFYYAYLEYIRHTPINPELQPQAPYINETFIPLILSILKEGSKLSQELSLPDISTFLYNQIQISRKPAVG
jgi:hypothetical protein|nr:MAG TPA: hypothetical protein [Caudoviricetes sp.]